MKTNFICAYLKITDWFVHIVHWLVPDIQAKGSRAMPVAGYIHCGKKHWPILFVLEKLPFTCKELVTN